MKLNEKQKKIFMTLHRALAREGYEVRLVGGAVRDILQGKVPKDLDFATDAKPNIANRLLSDFRIHTIPTGLAHGTITAIVNGESIELTTLRVDVETDGRHAEIEYTTDWEEDARRRDLTINAMYMDIDENIYDYFDGQVDLISGKLRFVGDTSQRVQEDYLRILRYFRFASNLDNLSWDYELLEVLQEHSPGLRQVSGERIWSELMRILSGKNRYNAMYAMDSYGILAAIGITWPLAFKEYWEFVRVNDSEQNRSPLVYLAAIIRDLNDIADLRARWKFDNNSFKILQFIVKSRNEGMVCTPDRVQPYLLTGTDPNLLYQYASYVGNWEAIEMLKTVLSNPLPKFPVNGNDLREAGVPPGPQIGSMLSEMKNKWIISGYKLSKEELISGR